MDFPNPLSLQSNDKYLWYFKILILTYRKFTPSGCKDEEIRKFELVKILKWSNFLLKNLFD